MRQLIVFMVAALLHFAVSVMGVIFTLPVAFDVRGGLEPDRGKALLVWTSSILLAPLAWIGPLLPEAARLGYGEIAIVSALFGAAVAGLVQLWRVVGK